MRRWALCIAALIGTDLASAHAAAPPVTGRVVWVTDGDTVRLASGERIRIAGIDAPESRPENAKCARELARGQAATHAAIPLLKGRTVTIDRVGKSYQRAVARLDLDGTDVGRLLIAEGIARPWPRGKPKPDWCGA
ncbi:MAG TPA: thermonuclease family protein [Sphingobium sp.]|uniref:thermonuclease family protein n=1 Tax=Sphingobium sp. TaxID=1912891 RepID=UPI002ED021EE